MIRVRKDPVERIIRMEDLPVWKSRGYEPVDPVHAAPVAKPEPEQGKQPKPEAKAKATDKRKPEIPEDLSRMKTAELKALAESIGVQGYQNMDKATLIAVIQAH